MHGGDALAYRALRIMKVDRLAIEDDSALVSLVDTAEDLDQGRFAGAIFADDGVDLPRPHSDGDLPQGMGTAERLGDITQLEEIVRRLRVHEGGLTPVLLAPRGEENGKRTLQ
jgi:hypothetical protein